LKKTCGQDVAEYALILALLSLGAVAALTPLAHTLSNTFKWAADCHSQAQASQARACQDTGPRTPPPKN
jgi:Flp pilus assembly pilin Flp